MNDTVRSFLGLDSSGDSDRIVDSAICVMKEFGLSYSELKELPLTSFFEMQKFLQEYYKER